MRKLIFVILLLIICSTVFSQSNMPEARNTIYLSFVISPEQGGLGLYYERMVSPNVSIRTGINYTYHYNFSFSLPITINYLTSNNNKFEIGLGGGPALSISTSGNRLAIVPAGSIGYRYQLESKSVFFKVGVDVPCIGFSFAGAGYHF